MSSAEPIVVSLEWAKKLKQAGFPQMTDDSYFFQDECAFPTAEEILRRLPHNTVVKFVYGEASDKSRCIYDNSAKIIDSDTLANAAAAMWVYLAENKLHPKADLHRTETKHADSNCTCCPTHRITMEDVTPDKSAPDLQ